MKKLLYAVFATALLTGGTACSSQTDTKTKENTTPTSIKLIVEEGEELEMGTPIMLLNNLGDTIAHMGKYSWTPEAKPGSDIIMVLADENWAFVDASGKEMDYYPYVFDNAPDDVSEGYMRVKNKDGKIGYADSLGHLVIEPKFFFAKPWKDGYGRVALEGTEEKHGEHSAIKIEKWSLVDSEGSIKPCE